VKISRLPVGLSTSVPVARSEAKAILPLAPGKAASACRAPQSHHASQSHPEPEAEEQRSPPLAASFDCLCRRLRCHFWLPFCRSVCRCVSAMVLDSICSSFGEPGRELSPRLDRRLVYSPPLLDLFLAYDCPGR
jgi:hypothetical protein